MNNYNSNNVPQHNNVGNNVYHIQVKNELNSDDSSNASANTEYGITNYLDIPQHSTPPQAAPLDLSASGPHSAASSGSNQNRTPIVVNPLTNAILFQAQNAAQRVMDNANGFMRGVAGTADLPSSFLRNNNTRLLPVSDLIHAAMVGLQAVHAKRATSFPLNTHDYNNAGFHMHQPALGVGSVMNTAGNHGGNESGTAGAASSTSYMTETRKRVTKRKPIPRNIRTEDAYRIVYTREQTQKLESMYARNKFDTFAEKKTIAAALGLSWYQVRNWFANRRAKDKKLREQGERGDVTSPYHHQYKQQNRQQQQQQHIVQEQQKQPQQQQHIVQEQQEPQHYLQEQPQQQQQRILQEQQEQQQRQQQQQHILQEQEEQRQQHIVQEQQEPQHNLQEHQEQQQRQQRIVQEQPQQQQQRILQEQEEQRQQRILQEQQEQQQRQQRILQEQQQLIQQQLFTLATAFSRNLT